jgi:hypothetical protein
MASGSPSAAFRNVDLPTFARPMIAMVPKRMGLVEGFRVWTQAVRG